MAGKWEVACRPGTCCPEGFILVDQFGNFMANDPNIASHALKQQNIFNNLVTLRDKKLLRNAMAMAADSEPQFLIMSIKFMDEVQNFRCQVIRTGQRFFIGGCRTANNIALFPPRARTA